MVFVRIAEEFFDVVNILLIPLKTKQTTQRTAPLNKGISDSVEFFPIPGPDLQTDNLPRLCKSQIGT